MIACLMTGCMPMSINLQRADQAVQLPVHSEAPLDPAIGDTMPTVSYYIPLHFVSADRNRLVPVSRAVIVAPGQSLITESLIALLSAESIPGAWSPFPQGTKLLSVERSGNAAVVDLSIDARHVESEQQILWMREAIASTLIGLDGIEYVHMLIAGKDEGMSSLPSGASGGSTDSLTTTWAQITAEQELLSRGGDESTPVRRTAILYYAAADGRYIAPVAQELRIESDDFITPVIEALRRYEGEIVGLRSPFPKDAEVLIAEPEIVENEAGQRMVRLVFDGSLITTMEREGLRAWQLYASLTYSLTAFVPDIDGLIVLIGDGQLTRTLREGQEVTFTGGEMTRAAYPDAVCRLGATYMTSVDGGLIRLYRPFDQKSAASPRALLGELFEGPDPWEEGASRVMPDGVSIEDVLGIRISGDEAVINLSSNFYRCCQSLTPQQEKNMIYAMVNALTELPAVSAVRFQVEGETVDYLIRSVYLRGALMRNPGIIR